MMQCIALDDEPKALAIIERYCSKVPLVHLAGSYREPLKALEYLSRREIDLLFLDIDMPGLNGMQLFSSLPIKPMVIFTTAYSQYAVDSYNVHAVDYLLKPITFERFLLSVTKAHELLTLRNKTPTTSQFVLLKSGSQTFRVKLDAILFLEKKGNYLFVHTQEMKILIRENMNQVFSILPEKGFLRVHKSFIVSLDHITSVEAHQLVLGTTKIPIGHLYKEELKKRLGMDNGYGQNAIVT